MIIRGMTPQSCSFSVLTHLGNALPGSLCCEGMRGGGVFSGTEEVESISQQHKSEGSNPVYRGNRAVEIQKL